MADERSGFSLTLEMGASTAQFVRGAVRAGNAIARAAKGAAAGPYGIFASILWLRPHRNGYCSILYDNRTNGPCSNGEVGISKRLLVQRQRLLPFSNTRSCQKLGASRFRLYRKSTSKNQRCPGKWKADRCPYGKRSFHKLWAFYRS